MAVTPTIMMLAACLAVLTPHAAALPQCNSTTVNIPGADKLVFAVVGDWGRVGAMDSMFSYSTVQTCRAKGQCCSSLQQPTFPDDFDATDVLDGPQQKLAATLLNDVCGAEGCQFVLGMGDNFYPCGADPLDSGLNRFKLDWQNVYKTAATPNISSLNWYHVLGNHDYGFATSVPLQVQYAQTDSSWVLPSPYYARTFTAGNVSMSISFLDETPFIGTYAHPKPKKAYYTPYLSSKITPDYINSDAAEYLNATSSICNIPPANASFLTSISYNATGQIPWLKSCLESSMSSTWSVISGHFALWGSDTQWAVNSSKSAYPGNCGGFGSLANLIAEYNVSAYFNGHDHTQTHSDPAHAGVMIGNSDSYGNLTYLVSGPNPATQYFTLGNGGSVQYADGVTLGTPKAANDFSSVIYNSNVQYAANQLGDATDSGNAAVGEGFAIVIADSCTMEVQFYNINGNTPDEAQAPVHTTVIDKCSKATVPANAASAVPRRAATSG